MKTYILLINGISEMGGGQMFVRNKYLLLKDAGWDVKIGFIKDGEIIIRELKKFKNGYLPDMVESIFFYSKKNVKRIINETVDKLCIHKNVSNQIIVETLTFSLVLWGELLSKKIGARHILNPIDEIIIDNPDNKLLNYIEFKILRKEFMNSSTLYLKRLLGSYYKEEYKKYEFNIIPYCSNVVLDIDYNDNLLKKDFNIVSVGRLDKPYVRPLIQEIKLFCEKYNQYSFNIIFIGGSKNGDKESQIQAEFKPLNNVNVLITGYLLPIPKKLLEKGDVGVSSSNSVLVTSNLGIPTVAIDAHDFFAIGIHGITTNNTVYRNTENRVQISDLLEEILIIKKYNIDKKNISASDDLVEIRSNLSPQLEYINSCQKDISYFDIESMFSFKKRLYFKLRWIKHKFIRRK